ncbi:monocarboxylic acid transporter [Pseudozyma hubeiensis SY62]|uniref:Monocarboxylic acid transporter n=1 Tax=Pseudozyma hubeiensis (strain SY62) TaxID=1305764 RepID=R9NZN7_PSEHS|nr:monocarboxylic acid transporter [Pseudozyma hubeiensis SY62]GAC94266.1 monocarboxylic acid transporter [Pseudozyma hubeiensis SY62]
MLFVMVREGSADENKSAKPISERVSLFRRTTPGTERVRNNSRLDSQEEQSARDSWSQKPKIERAFFQLLLKAQLRLYAMDREMLFVVSVPDRFCHRPFQRRFNAATLLLRSLPPSLHVQRSPLSLHLTHHFTLSRQFEPHRIRSFQHFSH